MDPSPGEAGGGDVARLAFAHDDVHAARISEFFSAFETGGEPDAAPEPPRQGPCYVIGFVNRSGSNLLARGLASTGVMGNPREAFNHPEVIDVAQRVGLRSLRGYARHIMRTTTTPNGVFGVKLGAGQLMYLRREGIVPSIIRDPAFVYVTRRDIVAQAISFVIATQTSRWTSEWSGNGAEPSYDPAAILASLRWICESQSMFEYYFALHRIRPLRYVYEDLETRLPDVIGEIAETLGLAARPTVALERIALRRQRTLVNEEFKARFLREVAPPRELT